MKQNNEKTGSKGWFEPRKDTVTNKGIRNISPRHYDVSRKKGCCNPLAKPLSPPKKTKEVIFKFEKNTETDKDFDKVMFEFFKENPEAEYDIEKNKLIIDKKYADALRDFLIKNDIDCDVFEDGDEVNKIIEEVQEGRKTNAVAIDDAQTAKKVGDKEDAEDLVSWVKEPGESDLENVDTKK